MPQLRPFPAVLAGTLFFAAMTAPAWPAETNPRACLNKEAQRAALAASQAIPLAQAIRAAHIRSRGEVVRARLCQGPNGLVYVLTLLARNGKVTRATLDAANGSPVSGR